MRIFVRSPRVGRIHVIRPKVGRIRGQSEFGCGELKMSHKYWANGCGRTNIGRMAAGEQPDFRPFGHTYHRNLCCCHTYAYTCMRCIQIRQACNCLLISFICHCASLLSLPGSESSRCATLHFILIVSTRYTSLPDLAPSPSPFLSHSLFLSFPPSFSHTLSHAVTVPCGHSPNLGAGKTVKGFCPSGSSGPG